MAHYSQYNELRWQKMWNWVNQQSDGVLIMVMIHCVAYRYKSIFIEIPEEF